ncbi:MAG: hypothetical protein OES32_00250 [Acidobacteriota bacterium]|nr:hypothetical protein [Acidobacteriota bacterium]MDH3521989.1 hypothetical protein [Acidobacteriota bacterium]
MDPDRFRAVYERLQLLDETSTYKVRPKVSLHRPTVEELDARARDLAAYTVELREIVDELMQAIAGRPRASPKAP